MTNTLLVEARNRLGKTQLEIALALGVAKSTINRWEKGKTFPVEYHRQKIIHLFDSSEQELGLLPEGVEAQEQFSFDPCLPMLPESLLIGREREIEQLSTRLISGGCGTLIALNGLPGVGKTSLAIALAHHPELRAFFNDGILWAELGLDPDLQTHLRRWGALLGFPSDEMSLLTTPEAWAVALQHTIGTRKILLVIDDAWTLEAVLALKIGGPNCAYLVITRLPLLATQIAVNGATTIKELNNEDGLLLLRLLAPQMVESEPQRARELVREVGGLPLALTFIGNYVRMHVGTHQERPISEVLDHISDARERLNLSATCAPYKHLSSMRDKTPSLSSVIDVTVHQLDQRSQAALFALSIFPPKPGTFSEEAALAVIGSDVKTIDLLSDTGLLESNGSDRYTLHHIIADYGRAHLDVPVAQEVYTRLIHYIIGYGKAFQKDHRLLEKESTLIFALLERVYRSELRDPTFLPGTLRCMIKLFAPWLRQYGHWQRVQPYLHSLSEGMNPQQDAVSRTDIAQCLEQSACVAQRRGISNGERESSLLHERGVTADLAGQYTQAHTYLLDGLALARYVNNRDLIAAHLLSLSAVKIHQDDFALAVLYSQEALAVYRQVDHPVGIIYTLNNLIVALEHLGECEPIERFLQEGLQLARQIDHTECIALMVSRQAILHERHGQYQQAFPFFLEGMERVKQLGNPHGQIAALIEMGRNAERRGAYGESATWFQKGLSLLHQEPGQEKYLLWIFACLSNLAIKRGDYSQAKKYCQEGNALKHSQQNHKKYGGLLLGYQALASVLQGQSLSTEIENGLHTSLVLAQESSNMEGLVSILKVFGEIEGRRGNARVAESYLQTACIVAKHARLENEESPLLTLLAAVAIQRKDYKRAGALLHKALIIALRQSCPEYLSRVHLALGELALQQQQMKAAYSAFQESIRTMPEENPLSRALAFWGLARIATTHLPKSEKKAYGSASLEILETIGHYHADVVRSWLRHE